MTQNEIHTAALNDHEKLIQARNIARKEIIEKTKEPEIEWLTENSRKFLESGYLTGNTTPEERIREIADNAEGILKIKGFSVHTLPTCISRTRVYFAHVHPSHSFVLLPRRHSHDSTHDPHIRPHSPHDLTLTTSPTTSCLHLLTTNRPPLDLFRWKGTICQPRPLVL